MDGSDPVRRLCALVAAEGSADGLPSDALVRTVENAITAAALDQGMLQVLPAGVLVVLNAGVNEARAVADLTTELRNALWRQNRQSTSERRLRCRIAFHQGLVRLTDDGFEGRAVAVVGALCGSPALRQALAGQKEHDLAMIISAGLLDEIAYPESDELHAEQFRPVTVTTPAHVIRAYVYAPERLP